jgi:hypothetical protein
MALGVGVVNTGSFAKLMWPGVHTIYGDNYGRFSKEFEAIFDKETSDKLYEEVLSTAGMGLALAKAEGSPTQYASFRQGLTTRFTNQVYSLGFVITKEVQADNQYAIKMTEMGSKFLAQSMLQLKETLGANVLNNGFSAQSSHIGGDGLALFSTAHTTISGVTFQNTPTSAADLSEAAIEQAVIDIGAFIDEAGLKIKAEPRKLIIPRQLQFTAERILKSPLRVGTADNDINAVKMMGVLAEGVHLNHYLTASKAWFMKTDVPNGLMLFEREGYETSADNDFDTDNAKFKAMERYVFDFADARGAYASSPA